MKKITLFVLMLCLMLVSGLVAAQTDTTDTSDDTTTTSDSESSVNWFFVACETSVVLDLTGFMEAGDDLYVQVFREIGTGGTPLTPLTQVSVSGDYQVSPQITFTGGEVLAFGQYATAQISIGREGSPSNTSFTGTVNDVQDGCVTPSYGGVDTTTADGDLPGGSTGTNAAQIYSPFGGIINPNIIADLPQENIVQLGARPSLNPFYGRQRSDTFGMIFAECNRYPGSEPGLLYDTDDLTIFWSWFASTPELLEDHMREARYQIWINSQSFPAENIIDHASRSQIQQREDGNYWVFYTIDLGDLWAPGEYSVGYRLEWGNPISDGYEEFGPGTATPIIESNCDFTIDKNPWGVEEPYRNPNYPYNLG